jgi:hypothetical protein
VVFPVNRLVLANVWAPGQVHHGATMVVDVLDPTGDVAVAQTLCRFAGDYLSLAEKRLRAQGRDEGVTGVTFDDGRRVVLREDLGGNR